MISQDLAQQNLEMIYQLRNHVKIQDGVSQERLARVRELEGIVKVMDGVSQDRLGRIYELKSQVGALEAANAHLQKPCLQSRITNQRKQLADFQTAYSRKVAEKCRYTTDLRAKVETLEARVQELEGELDRVSQKLALKAESRGEA